MELLNKEQIKEKIEELADKVKGDEKILDKFKADPVKTIEGLLGIDLPDETVMKIVDGVKAKIGVDKVSSIVSKIGDLFKKD